MLGYLYTADYDDTLARHTPSADLPKSSTTQALVQQQAKSSKRAKTSKGSPRALLFNTKVYIAADKFDIPALKKLATEKYTASVSDHWNSPEFCEGAHFLWNNSMAGDRTLRDVVITAGHQNFKSLLDRGEFVTLMKEHGDFGLEIAKGLKGIRTPEPPTRGKVHAAEQPEYYTYDDDDNYDYYD